MRTTLDIDDDILRAAKERAQREGKTAGKVISELARLALTQPASPRAAVRERPGAYGFVPFAATGRPVSNDVIDELRGDDAY